MTLYIGKQTGEPLKAIRPAGVAGPELTGLWIVTRQIGRRGKAAAEATGLGKDFTGHIGRVGMAQDLVKSGVELPALMTAGRWKSAKMPACYTDRQAADRGTVARSYPKKSG